MGQVNHVSVEIRASYHTLNELTRDTKHIWLVCHGYGQLSEHFIGHFDELDAETHHVIALQGLSKFYLPGHRQVGASWMTKEDRAVELTNQQAYFSSVMSVALDRREIADYQIHLLGFSQGVSAICRLAAHLQLPLASLILWAGSFPPELQASDFSFLSGEEKIYGVLGDNDRYFDTDLYGIEMEKVAIATGIDPELIPYQGAHELNPQVLNSIVSKF